jgi:transcriptional regulator with XRE-family HTH domain
MNLQDIGARILHVRTEIIKLPQREFAQVMGMGQGNMSKIEKGQSLPSCFFLVSLYKTYRVNVNWVLSGDGPMLAEKPEPEACPV